MLNLDGLQGPHSELAHALDEPSFSLDPGLLATARVELQKAITILLHQHDDIIFAYLRFARSSNQNTHYSSGHGSLSSAQFLAVWALRDCADDEIRTWLEEARKLSSDPEQPKVSAGDTPQEPAFALPSSLGQTREILHDPSVEVPVCAPVRAVQNQGSYQSTLSASPAHPQKTLDKTDTTHKGTKAAVLYWCTTCNDRRSYKNLSAWRKHEKEHLNTYVCILRGPQEETEGGFKCILCGTLDPSTKHVGEHNIQICGQGVPGSFSSKRRADLVKHLQKCHDVQGKAQGEAIAHKWKETIKKQAWSCGFCTHLCHTFGDRLKHIATHFERGQTLDDWDTTKEIEGLLSQPGMIDAWKRQLGASLLDWEAAKIIWEKHPVEGLRHDLEVGPSSAKHAAALAKAAYEARRSSGHSPNGDKPLAPALTHGALGLSPIVPTNDYNSIMERAFNSDSNRDHAQYIANPAQALHHGVQALGGVPTASQTYDTFSGSSSNDENSSINAAWLFDPGQTWPSTIDQYINPHGYGYREHSNATAGSYTRPTPARFSDEANTDDMFE